jgi:extradiol dioxygenase family protein
MVSLKDYRCGAAAAVSDMQRARRFYEKVLGLDGNIPSLAQAPK